MSSDASKTSALLALSNDLATAAERAGRAVVAVNARPRLSSTGVHWSPGVIVAAEHAVSLEEGITITDAEGHTIPATLAGRDPTTDLAVLKIAGGTLPPADLGDPSALRAGHLVLALGRGPSVSWGVVSRVGGPWQTWRGGRIDQLLRLDLTLYPGFSGGPLVDASGRVVGITTSGLSRHVALAVPATTVSRVADELLRSGRVARGYLGVGLQPVRIPPDLASRLPGGAEAGLIMVSVEPDGPAARAGMVIGDVLVALDGTAVTDMADVQALLGPERVGSPVRATILRGGAPHELTITVGDRPRRSR